MSRSVGTILIDRMHRGPERSGNGGWTAGLLAAHLSDAPAVTVTLRRPPPLDVPLEVCRNRDRLEVVRAGVVLAEAVVAERPAPVHPVGADLARAAESDYAGLAGHPFPGCFVCGTTPVAGAGLRLRPGRFAPGRTACTWEPHQDHVETAHVWAALDCPGGWTADIVGRPMVLGRITVSVRRRPRAGEVLVVVGALLDTQGRRSSTAASVYDDAGREVGTAAHTWIRVDPSMFA